MRHLVTTTAALAALAVSPAAASAAAPKPVEHGSLDQQISYAMTTEAFAYAEYNAFAAGAAADGKPVSAALWRTIADIEHWDHFVAEGQMVGLIGSNSANLKAAIKAEDDASDGYARGIKIANSEGCTQVAKAYDEIRSDELDHHKWFKQALGAIRAGGTAPAPPAVKVVAIKRAAAACPNAKRTQADLLRQMEGESLAWSNYTQWAQGAANSGRPDVAALLDGIADVELEDHFALETNLRGHVGTVAENLRESIKAERGAITLYGRIAKLAAAKGHAADAKRLREIRRDEGGHLRSFRLTLARPR